MTEPTTIDDILAGADTVMTPELIRLFKVAGCSPTECHACQKEIGEGKTFKLLSHNDLDEMLCAKCGKPELVKRDKVAQQRAHTFPTGRGSWVGSGGFSRPSKGQS